MKKLLPLSLCLVALGAIFCSPGHAQVVNGNFASGDFTGWSATPSGDPFYTVVTNQAPVAGSTYAASIGAYYDDSFPANLIVGSVVQTIPTVAGQQYTISFLYGELNVNPSFGGGGAADCCYLDADKITSSHDPNVSPWAENNTLQVLVDGNPAFSASNFLNSDLANTGATNPDDGKTPGDYSYQSGAFSLIASGASTVLEFDLSDYQQAALLTNVTVPEPGTLALFATAIAGFGFLRRRRLG